MSALARELRELAEQLWRQGDFVTASAAHARALLIEADTSHHNTTLHRTTHHCTTHHDTAQHRSNRNDQPRE